MTMRDLLSHEPYIPSVTCDVTHSIDMTPSHVSALIHVYHDSFMHRMTHLSFFKIKKAAREHTPKNLFLFSCIYLHACQDSFFFVWIFFPDVVNFFSWYDMGANDVGLPDLWHDSFMLIVGIPPPQRWSLFWVVQSQEAGGTDFSEMPCTNLN